MMYGKEFLCYAPFLFQFTMAREYFQGVPIFKYSGKTHTRPSMYSNAEKEISKVYLFAMACAYSHCATEYPSKSVFQAPPKIFEDSHYVRAFGATPTVCGDSFVILGKTATGGLVTTTLASLRVLAFDDYYGEGTYRSFYSNLLRMDMRSTSNQVVEHKVMGAEALETFYSLVDTEHLFMVTMPTDANHRGVVVSEVCVDFGSEEIPVHEVLSAWNLTPSKMTYLREFSCDVKATYGILMQSLMLMVDSCLLTEDRCKEFCVFLGFGTETPPLLMDLYRDHEELHFSVLDESKTKDSRVAVSKKQSILNFHRIALLTRLCAVVAEDEWFVEKLAEYEMSQFVPVLKNMGSDFNAAEFLELSAEDFFKCFGPGKSSQPRVIHEECDKLFNWICKSSDDEQEGHLMDIFTGEMHNAFVNNTYSIECAPNRISISVKDAFSFIRAYMKKPMKDFFEFAIGIKLEIHKTSNDYFTSLDGLDADMNQGLTVFTENNLKFLNNYMPVCIVSSQKTAFTDIFGEDYESIDAVNIDISWMYNGENICVPFWRQQDQKSNSYVYVLENGHYKQLGATRRSHQPTILDKRKPDVLADVTPKRSKVEGEILFSMESIGYPAIMVSDIGNEDIVGTVGGHRFTGEMLKRLVHKKWLCDTIINLFLKLVVDTEKYPGVTVIDPTMQQYVLGNKHFENITEKLQSAGFKVTNDTIYMAWNILQFHWCVVAIERKSRIIYIMDSMKQYGSIVHRDIFKKFVKMLVNVGYTDKSFEWTHGPNVSNFQADGYNCGVFAIFNIFCSIKNGRTSMPKKDQMISCRKEILKTLLDAREE